MATRTKPTTTKSKSASVLKTTSSTITTTLVAVKTGVSIIGNELTLILESNKLDNVNQFANDYGITVAEAKEVLKYD